MTIHIDALTFDVIIGLLDFERDRPQPVIVDIQADYAYDKQNFIDYADMVLLVENELKEKRYVLLEDALNGIKTTIYSSYPQLISLYIKIAKPTILPQCSVAISHTWELSASH